MCFAGKKTAKSHCGELFPNHPRALISPPVAHQLFHKLSAVQFWDGLFGEVGERWKSRHAEQSRQMEVSRRAETETEIRCSRNEAQSLCTWANNRRSADGDREPRLTTSELLLRRNPDVRSRLSADDVFHVRVDFLESFARHSRCEKTRRK